MHFKFSIYKLTSDTDNQNWNLLYK